MVNSYWAGYHAHCCLATGFSFIMAGAAVLYKTRFQRTDATSSTEAKFVAALDVSKMALYLRSLLCDLHVMQHEAVVIYEANLGAYKMASSGKPMLHTRHIDVHHFSLLDQTQPFSYQTNMDVDELV